jgi:hypothetical protein
MPAKGVDQLRQRVNAELDEARRAVRDEAIERGHALRPTAPEAGSMSITPADSALLGHQRWALYQSSTSRRT